MRSCVMEGMLFWGILGDRIPTALKNELKNPFDVCLQLQPQLWIGTALTSV